MSASPSTSDTPESLSIGREQCYICWATINPSPPAQTKSREALHHDHHEYLLDLEHRGILFGAGALQDENGRRFGAGMFIIRAKSRAEAETIASKEPYTVAGVRTVELTPWRRSAGAVTLTVKFSSGLLQADSRTYALNPID